jgi:hypothetical protein
MTRALQPPKRVDGLAMGLLYKLVIGLIAAGFVAMTAYMIFGDVPT